MEEQRQLPAADEPSVDAKMREWAAWARDAEAQKKWDEAEKRWARCIEIFGPHSKWLAQRARALVHIEQFEEAERIFLALLHEDSRNPGAVAGLADVALRRNDHGHAVQLLTSWRSANPDLATPAMAKLLMTLGEAEQSHALWKQITRERPDVPEFQASRLRAAIEVCRNSDTTQEWREALTEEIRSLLLTGGDEKIEMSALSLFSLVEANDEAAKLLRRCVGTARSIPSMIACFRHIPVLIERGSRGAFWEMLLERVLGMERSAQDRAAAHELELCILLALGRHSEFCERFDAAGGVLDRRPVHLLLRRVRERLGRPRSEVFLEPKIFGIGLSRTGTTSLHEALLQLGIDSAHWTNPLTHEMLSDADVFLFGASSDICIAQDFEKLYYFYPNARFIWTQRPFDPWQKSFAGHHAYHNWARTFDEIRPYYSREGCHYGFSSAVTHFGLYLNADNLADAYRSFEKRVRSFFADKRPGRMLELDVSSDHAWQELCAFLDLPVPDSPFPHANRSRLTPRIE